MLLYIFSAYAVLGPLAGLLGMSLAVAWLLRQQASRT